MDRKFKRKASMTIELSLLMPLVLASVILVIFMCFYMHDTCIIQKACYISALRISENREDASEGVLIESFDKYTEKNLLGRWEINRSLEFTDGQVRITAKGKMLYNNFFLSDKIFLYNTESKVTNIFEPDYIREKRNELQY